MNRLYVVLIILSAVLHSSAVLANFNLYTSEYQDGSNSTSILNSDIDGKDVSGISWKDVGISNNRLGNYAEWMGDTTNNLEPQIMLAQFSPSLGPSNDNEKTDDLRVEASLAIDAISENSDISAPKNHESAVTDSASILLFCFGVGITGLISIRKKFVKVHHHPVH